MKTPKDKVKQVAILCCTVYSEPHSVSFLCYVVNHPSIKARWVGFSHSIVLPCITYQSNSEMQETKKGEEAATAEALVGTLQFLPCIACLCSIHPY